ncbi:MAG: sodium:solute symporter family protein [Gammaproteobacteria bacterium]
MATKTATDYMIAGRGVGPSAFAFAATAACFGAWALLDQPGLIHREGLPYGYLALAAIAIPLTGVLFLKRQWLLSERIGFVTPGEMFYAYYKSFIIRFLTAIIALVFAIAALGILLKLTAALLAPMINDSLPIDQATLIVTAVLVLYVALGGWRAVAQVGSLQFLLFIAGIAILSVTVYRLLPDPRAALTALFQGGASAAPLNAQFITIPGVIDWMWDSHAADGAAWTGVTLLSIMIALLGIQASPAFSMWAFAARSPAVFAPQQVLVSAFIVGFLLLVGPTIQGLGVYFLGADAKLAATHPTLVNAVLDAGKIDASTNSALAMQLILLTERSAPWLVSLLLVCALAAIQAASATHLSAAASTLTRDLSSRSAGAGAGQQKAWSFIFALLIAAGAVALAWLQEPIVAILNHLVLGYGLQLWPALIGVCWWPFLTGAGVTLGLFIGLIAVTLTEPIGTTLATWLLPWVGPTLGIDHLPWGRWPLGIHSAVWGLACNLIVALLVSALTQNAQNREHRMIFHNFLDQHAGLSNTKKGSVPLVWVLALAWFYFGVGPGVMIGNHLFGDPAEPASWLWGIPSIWIWQAMFWALGVILLWILAVNMELSTDSEANAN